MTECYKFEHRFVRHVPEVLEPRVLYISIEFASAIHLCACGCGHQVVTPLSPSDWRMEFDGESVSLNPSIGNWAFECQSHYFIRRDAVVWLPEWDDSCRWWHKWKLWRHDTDFTGNGDCPQ